MLLCVAAHTLYCVLFVPLSRELFDDVRPGLWAGFVSALVPTIPVSPQWEAIYAAVALQCFCLATARLARSKLSPVAQGLASGALCGVVLLLNPVLLLVAVVWLLYLRCGARWVMAFTAGAVLVVLPWTIRNYRQFHAVFLIRDNLGSELAMSNADCSDARDSVNDANGCHDLLQPNRSRAEAEAIRREGEVPHNRARLETALGWIAGHPARFAWLTVERFREFWFPSADGVRVYTYARWGITILSVPGLVLLVRKRRRAALFLGGSMLLYPIIYYFIQANLRYRSPVLWISVLPAAFALSRAVRPRALK
jgi:hypothetical protein